MIGYRYYGGFTEWTPSTGKIVGTHSPVKLTQAMPYWCLAADLVAKINGSWGGVDTDLPLQAQQACAFIPQHRQGNKGYPQGGNEVFVDGSAGYYPVTSMYQFTTWAAGREFCFYRKFDDITDDASLATIANLKWKPSDQ